MRRIAKDKYLLIFVLTALTGVIFYLSTQQLMYVDDFVYGTFFRGGLSGFFEQTLLHYRTSNGRVFVHALVNLVLVFDTLLFPVVNTALLLGLAFLTARDEDSLLPGIVFFTATFMLIHVTVLRQGFLWLSGAFNYTFPVLMLAGVLCAYRQHVRRGVLKWYLIPLAFLAGATTEQVGATAVFALAAATAVYIRCGELTLRKSPKSLYVLLPALLGWLSILSSGATRSRMEAENIAAVRYLFSLLIRAQGLSHVAFDANAALIFAITAVLIALRVPKLRAGLAYAVFVLVLTTVPGISFAPSLFMSSSVLFFGVCAIYFVVKKIHTESAVLIAAAFFSMFIMLFTESHSTRVVMPLLLMMIAVGAHFVRFTKEHTSLLAVYAAVCLFAFMPVVSGFRANNQIMRENLASIARANAYGGDIFYNIDFDDVFRHTMAHDRVNAYRTFRIYHRIAPETRIYFVSEKHPPVYTADGARVRMPARYENGELFFAMLPVMEELGAVYESLPTHSYLHINNKTHRLLNTQRGLYVWRNGEYVRETSPHSFQRAYRYWHTRELARVFGVAYEKRGGVYIVFLEEPCQY